MHRNIDTISPNRKVPYQGYQMKTEYAPPNEHPPSSRRTYFDADFSSEVAKDLQKQSMQIYKNQVETEFLKQEEQIRELLRTVHEQEREITMLRQVKEQYAAHHSANYRMKEVEEHNLGLINELSQRQQEIEQLKHKIYNQQTLLKEASSRVKELEQLKLKINDHDGQLDQQVRKYEEQALNLKKQEDLFRQKIEKLEDEVKHLKNMLQKEESQREYLIQQREGELNSKLSQHQTQCNSLLDKNKQLTKQNDELTKNLDRSNQLVDSLEDCLKDLQRQYESNKHAVDQLSKKNRQAENNLIKDCEVLQSQLAGISKDNMILTNQLGEKDDFIKQLHQDTNRKLQEQQEAQNELVHSNQELQKYNDELKLNIISYKALIEEMRRMQGEQFQKEQEYQKMEVKDISNKYGQKLEMVSQENYQLRLSLHAAEEDKEQARQQIKQMQLQIKAFQDNQTMLEKEIFAWREKYKEMQSRLEVELKGFEDKRLQEQRGFEERAQQVQDKLNRKVQGLQALVKDRNQEIEALQSQKNELLLKICEGESLYANVRSKKTSEAAWR